MFFSFLPTYCSKYKRDFTTIIHYYRPGFVLSSIEKRSVPCGVGRSRFFCFFEDSKKIQQKSTVCASKIKQNNMYLCRLYSLRIALSLFHSRIRHKSKKKDSWNGSSQQYQSPSPWWIPWKWKLLLLGTLNRAYHHRDVQSLALSHSRILFKASTVVLSYMHFKNSGWFKGRETY